MAMKTYFDFAENDYQYFMHSYNHGIVANAMAADAQEICEKYMKHMIDQYYEPKESEDAMEAELALRTHNLVKLIHFLSDHMDVNFSKETQRDLRAINGYYFTARYPGDESVEVQKEDIEFCASAVKNCREELMEYIQQIEKELSEEQESKQEIQKNDEEISEQERLLKHCFEIDMKVDDQIEESEEQCDQDPTCTTENEYDMEL